MNVCDNCKHKNKDTCPNRDANKPMKESVVNCYVEKKK